MKKLGVVMDPIAQIKRDKDTTYAMMLEALTRDWTVHIMQPEHLFLQDSVTYAHTRTLTLYPERDEDWYTLSEPTTTALGELDVILMRKDPPFDMEYIYTTYLLEFAEQAGAWVINKPQGLRDANEKVFVSAFPDLISPTLVTRNHEQILQFVSEHNDVVLKPLHGMQGKSVFKTHKNDLNLNVILETLTENGYQTIMAQRYIPAVTEGDKRILLINGEPIPYGIVRTPRTDDFRANLAAGGTCAGAPLTDHEYKICERLAPMLREKGLWFTGIDVIGDFVTEINVTSPTCAREIDAAFDTNIAGKFFDFIEQRLNS